MGGGLMQLVAMGAQDVFLTGNPHITFFKVVYRRHTNFSKECIKQEFNGSVNKSTSSSVTCTLARNGDLVQEIYLNANVKGSDAGNKALASILTNTITLAADHGFGELEPIYFDKDLVDANGGAVITARKVYFATNVQANTKEFKVSYLNSDGTLLLPLLTLKDVPNVQATNVYTAILYNRDLTSLVQTVELEIGGQKIDKHYAAWLDIYNELFEDNHDYRASLTVPWLTNVNGMITDVNEKSVYIPLRFWFNRNAGLALPLIALQYHEVKVLMTLDPTKHTNLEIINAKLMVNYIYLDTDERRRFAQVSHEYLIEQVQHTGAETVKANKAGRVDMNFNHPIKALLWVGAGAAHLDDVKVQLNGHDRFSEQKADYFHLLQPYECGMGLGGKSLDIFTRQWDNVVKAGAKNSIGMYSFCLKPKEHQPSGSCNFSRIDNARLSYKSVGGADDTLHLFALNYNVLRIMSGMGGLTYSN